MKTAIASSGPVCALGAMSGTSMDGVDAAVLITDGIDIQSFGESGYAPYSDAQRGIISEALNRWEGPEVVAAARVVEDVHAQVLTRFPEAELVGFHGQTLAHAPHEGRTLQVGDGGVLAAVLERPVVWDFRSDDVAMGGQGAPLAPFFHFACARWIKATRPLCFLNLGGVANITWIDPSQPAPDNPGALLAFDCGPANAPVNDLMMARRSLPMDKGGALAAKGHVETGALELFLAEPFFNKRPPKSLDRNDFAEMIQLVGELDDADAAATLTAMCAAGVVQGIEHCPEPPEQILVTGGGRHNPVMMEMLRAGLDCPVEPVESVGLDGDMLEAQAFAYLAVRVARGLPTSCPGTTGVRAALGGGVISTPESGKS